MDEQNIFDFEHYEKVIQEIEEGKPSPTTPIKKEIKPEPVKVEESLTHYKRFFPNPQVGDCGIINFLIRDFYGIDGNLSIYENQDYYYYISKVKSHSIIIHLFSTDTRSLSFYSCEIIESSSRFGSLESNRLPISRLTKFDSSDPLFISEEIFNLKLQGYDDWRSEEYIKKCNAYNQQRYDIDLKNYHIKLNSINAENIIKEACTFAFNDNWELKLNYERKTAYDMGSSWCHLLTMYFPLITIRNNKGRSHVIKDFYLNMYLDKNFRVSSNLMGKRGTVTLEEWQKGYGHSHMNGGIANNWGSMCLGSGTPLVNMFSILADSANFNLDNMTALMLLIKGYVEWESLEGGPYKKIGDLVPTQKIGIPINFMGHRIINAKKFLLKEIQNTETYNNLVIISKDNNKCKVNINSNSFTEFSNKYINNSYLFESSELCLKNDNDEYFSISNSGINNVERALQDANYIIAGSDRIDRRINYKGQSIRTVVVNEAFGDVNVTKCINPNFLSMIMKSIMRDINKYYLKLNKNELSNMQQKV